MAGETKHYRYLIVGGGMTADAAVRGIRGIDAAGSIGLFSMESDAPYNRPPLTKGLWKGKPADKIFRKTGERGVEMHLGRRITAIDPAAHSVVDDQGVTYTYDKLLLATGGVPRKLPFDTGQDSGIIYYRTLADYRRLREATDRSHNFLVIGGGFIGSEIAAALSMNGNRVIMVFPEELIGQRMYPRALAEFITGYYRDKGVTIIDQASVAGVDRSATGYTVKVQPKTPPAGPPGQFLEFPADAVVAGLGIVPSVELAEAAGLKVDGGIVVDEGLRTSNPDMYAAGDVAKFHNPALDKWMRVEHEDNANTMGTAAGQAMARNFVEGDSVRYEHLPFFYSDLFELGYEAVGELDSRLETVADWRETFRKGVIYYLKDGRVRGVLLWDVWGKTDAARELIAQPGPFTPEQLKGKIPVE